MPSRYFDSSNQRLDPRDLFEFREQPQVVQAFDALLLAEACYERLSELRQVRPVNRATAAFINAYYDLWDVVIDARIEELRSYLAADPETHAYLARLPMDRARMTALIEKRRKESQASKFGGRGIKTAMYWLRGDGTPRAGMLPDFQRLFKTKAPPVEWLRMGRLLGNNPRGPEEMEAISSRLPVTHYANAAYEDFKAYADSYDEGVVKRAAQDRREYMRNYQRMYRAKHREALKPSAKALQAAGIRNSDVGVWMPEPDIDPLS